MNIDAQLLLIVYAVSVAALVGQWASARGKLKVFRGE